MKLDQNMASSLWRGALLLIHSTEWLRVWTPCLSHVPTGYGPGTHAGYWLSLRACLDGYTESHWHWDLIPRPSNT